MTMRRYYLYILLLFLPLLTFAKRPSVKDVPTLVDDYHVNMKRGETYSAYVLISRVDSIYKVSSDAQKEKLFLQGNSRTFINLCLEEVGEQALNEADAIGRQEAYDNFLNIYSQVPKALRQEAMALRKMAPAEQFASEREEWKKQWLFEHERVIMTCSLSQMNDFRKSHSYRLFPEEKIKDDLWRLLPATVDSTTFIRTLAPYYPAFRMLVSSITPFLLHGSYDEAVSEVTSYADVFGLDYRYNDLLRVLSEAKNNPGREELWHELFVGVYPDRMMYCPALSADDRFLYFCGRDVDTATGAQSDEDIYVSAREGDDWAQPLPLSELCAPQRNDAIESVSTDGSQVFMFINGSTYVTTRTADGWMPLRPWSKEINKMSHWVSDVHLTADGRAALFAMAVPNVLMAGENVDIFVALRDEKGEWGAPFSIGNDINTIRDERSPMLHPDGRTLYFTSNSHSSIGGYDIFRSRRLNLDSWTEWSQPENVGLMVNSVQNETFFAVNTQGTALYMSSGPKTNPRLYEMPLPESMRPDPVATLAGFIHTPQGKPLGVDIRWQDLTTGEDLGFASSNPKDGSFFLTLPLGHLYGYYVDEQGYMPASDNIDLRPVTEASVQTTDIELMPIKMFVAENKIMEIHNLFFALDKADILPESLPELRRLAQLIKRIRQHVEIAGHADNSGSAQHNLMLSQARADAVRDFLIREGCEVAMISSVGYGDTRPVATNDTEEGRSRNRRVEIVIK